MQQVCLAGQRPAVHALILLVPFFPCCPSLTGRGRVWKESRREGRQIYRFRKTRRAGKKAGSSAERDESVLRRRGPRTRRLDCRNCGQGKGSFWALGSGWSRTTAPIVCWANDSTADSRCVLPCIICLLTLPKRRITPQGVAPTTHVAVCSNHALLRISPNAGGGLLVVSGQSLPEQAVVNAASPLAGFLSTQSLNQD